MKTVRLYFKNYIITDIQKK